MAVIARWTTPSITYKPSKASIEDVDEIFMVAWQGSVSFEFEKGDADIDENGFTWKLSQEQTGEFKSGRTAEVQIDYTTVDGDRYTTNPKVYIITESAKNEAI